MKNPTVKKIFACVAVLTVLTGSAQGAYKVEIDDDTYVSDEVYFAPVSTWDEVKAQRINLKQGKVLFYAGKENEPYKIAAEVMPLNTTNKKITYKSEDITIAAVDENGVVTPTDKIGDTFIDIRCGNALSKLKVSVVKGVEGVAMSQSEMTLYADKPITAKLTAMVSPTDATIQKVRWTMSRLQLWTVRDLYRLAVSEQPTFTQKRRTAIIRQNAQLLLQRGKNVKRIYLLCTPTVI